jgi:hypothetical protein
MNRFTLLLFSPVVVLFLASSMLTHRQVNYPMKILFL